MDLSTCNYNGGGGGGAIKFCDRYRHNRRRRQVLRDNVDKYTIRRLARNGGVKRIVYPFQDIDDPSTRRIAILQKDIIAIPCGKSMWCQNCRC